MKIGLINPNKNVKDPAVHLGLGYIAAYASQYESDATFSLLDTRVMSSKETQTFLNTKFDLIGITASSQVFQEALALTAIIKKNSPTTPVCIGGPHASILKGSMVSDYPFDYAVAGEGEQTFLELIQYLQGKKSMPDIPGLIFKNEKKTIYHNGIRDLIGNIDSIPFPAYELFPMKKYPHHRIITSRGCPYNCAFCNSKTIWTRKWRMRSPGNVIAEIQYLIDNYGRKTFTFNDDSFNIDAARVNKICDHLLEKNLRILWGTSIRGDRINPETAKKMKESGCFNVNIGIESANEEVLRRMNKNLSKEKIFAGIQTCRQAGLEVNGQFMIGNPGDTPASIKESVDFARSSGLTNVEFYTALPYPGTDLWEFVQNHGVLLADKDFSQFHTIQPRIIFETPEFSYQDRLTAVELVTEAGFYTAAIKDKKNILLDTGKFVAKRLQTTLGPMIGNKLYKILRGIYRFINKHTL